MKFIRRMKDALRIRCIFFLMLVTVIILSIGGFLLEKESGITACATRESKEQCWSEVIKAIIESQGIHAALDVTKKLYSDDASFRTSCHAVVHIIGEQAYKKFSRGEEFKVTPATSICAVGFYHGFMESLLHKTGDMKGATSFCEYVDNQIKAFSSEALLQCFHGIGHGAVGVHDPRTWGEAQRMIAPALRLCEEASSSNDELYRCVSGVYNGIANFYMAGEYELSVDKDHPLTVCARQRTPAYQEACYGNMNTVLLWLTNNDFKKAALFVVRDVPPSLQHKTMSYLSAHYAHETLDNPDYTEHIQSCRQFNGFFKDCIRGFVGGIIEHGISWAAAQRALVFCNQLHDEKERNMCVYHIIDYGKQWYTPQEFMRVCSALPLEFQQKCSIIK